MNVLIIDQCSKSKAHSDPATVFDRADIDAHGRQALTARDNVPTWPARKLYVGRQQRYINDAVDGLRADGHTVDRYFISAGFGLVEETTDLPPYSVTFAEMTDQAIKQRAQELALSADIHRLVSGTQEYDVVFFALGQDYILGLDLDAILPAVTETAVAVLFNQETAADRMENVISIPARTEEAKTQGAIVVALKGVYLRNFAAHVGQGTSITAPDEIKSYCMDDVTTQTEFDQYG